MAAKITGVEAGSPAARAGLRPEETLISINGQGIRDVLDYKFYSYDTRLELVVLGAVNQDGAPPGERKVAILKSEGEDLGLSFATYLIDQEKSCSNKCVFCFIDQLPQGMRPSLYYKDDDARLSFLTGNYITMTNLTDRDADRIIRMHVSPLNISVHTTDPTLRDKMLGSRRGGASLKYLYQFAGAGLILNTQIVVCPGLNDGKALDKTLADLSALGVNSIAVVPVGLTRYRAGLYPLDPVSRDNARNIIGMVDACRGVNERSGRQTVCAASDELYLLAGLPVPPEDYYGGFDQLDNGVGLLRLFQVELEAVLRMEEPGNAAPFTVVTGKNGFLREMIDLIGQKCDNLVYDVFEIENEFFGSQVNVTGLVTGGDILAQLLGNIRHPRLLIPEVMLRHGERVFLDDISVEDLETLLGVTVQLVPMDGGSLYDAIFEIEL